jgi:hypothetical protein
MPAARLPEDGELGIGPVRLPEGRRTLGYRPGDRFGPPVAWVTITPVPDPGGVWAGLVEASSQIGLVPFIAWDEGEPRRLWDDGIHPSDHYFDYPADLAAADQIDPAAVLRTRWAEQARVPTEQEEPDPWWREWARAQIAPFSDDFPGLAPACAEPLDVAQQHAAISVLPPGRIGLAGADRPADALAAMGWRPGNWVDGVQEVTAVLRSWEDRFGTRLLGVGRDQFMLLTERPPRGLPTAQLLAAEVFALGPNEFFTNGDEEAVTEVSRIADVLIKSPCWGLWWD